MKNKSLNLSKIIVGVLVASFTLGMSINASAQGKPKGKPWPAPETAQKMKNPVKADDATLKEGKDLYAQHCKSCHGVKGKGDGPKAEKIDISCGDFTEGDYLNESDGASYWRITEGRKPMPSYKEKLSDHERWAVVAYIRTLGKGK